MAAILTLRRMPPFVAAVAIIQRDGLVLMVRDRAQNMLVLPGGHLRWTESVEQGVRREVLEETGYSVEPLTFVRALDSSSGLADRGIIRMVVEAKIVAGEEQSSPEGEVVWIPLDHIPNETARDALVLQEWLERRSPK